MALSKKLAFLAGSVTLVLASTVALAATTNVSDPAGDVKGSLPGYAVKKDVDILKASAGTAGNKVEFTLRVKGSIDAALKKIDTSPGFIMKKPGASHPGFDVYGTSHGYTAENYKGDSESANLTVSGGDTALLTFKPGPIGLPGNYKWSAVTGVCKPFDSAPDSGWASGQTGKRC
jgi:hypothetical protein